MAEAAGIYEIMWHPERLDYVSCAADMVNILTAGLYKLITYPERFHQHAPANYWGTHESFIVDVETLLKACVKYPGATIETRT